MNHRGSKWGIVPKREATGELACGAPGAIIGSGRFFRLNTQRIRRDEEVHHDRSIRARLGTLPDQRLRPGGNALPVDGVLYFEVKNPAHPGSQLVLKAGNAGTGPSRFEIDSSSLKAASTFSQCRGKADASYARSAGTPSDSGKRDAAYVKCDDGLVKGYAAAEIRYGSDCATPGDVDEAKTYLTQCADDLGASVVRGGSVPDYVAEISACNARYLNRLLKTGRTTSAGAGSDGNLQRGAPHSFTDNGDGTVTDDVTGLTWEKKSDDDSWHDKDDAYRWADAASLYMNGDITVFLDALNTPPCFANHCDWRIPNRKELESLTNLENFDPSTFNEFHKGCKPGCTVTTCSCTASGPYWTSTTNPVYPERAFDVEFHYGGSHRLLKNEPTNRLHVRAVRGG